MTGDVESVVEERFDGYLDDLRALLEQPSISSTGEGIDACVERVVEYARSVGLDARRIETSRYPVVYAERVVDESKPTLCFYGHYDVQPPGDEGEWESPAFEPTVRDGSLYARGAGDNKGQFMAHLFALDALEGAGVDPPVNVKFVLEGGEENGSVGLEGYLADDPPELADVDLVYVADGPMHRSRRPTLIYGNRGLLSVQLDLERAKSDLHSGNFGGPVPNAANDLVATLASMYDGTEPTFEGAHEGVAVTDADREMVDRIPCDEAAMREELGLESFASETPYYERLLLEPAFSVNGVTAGYGGEGMKTVIPHRASAKLDVRLVPDQRPETVLDRIESHVERWEPAVTVTKLASFPPMKTPLDTPAADVVRGALADVWGTDPVEMPVLGGSLPAAYFRESLDVPVLVVPYANPDQANHSPNEHLDLDCLRNGIATSALVVRRFDGVDGA